MTVEECNEHYTTLRYKKTGCRGASVIRSSDTITCSNPSDEIKVSKLSD